MAARASVNQILGTLSFLQGKFGEQAVKAYRDWMAGQAAKGFRTAKASSPAKFAEANALLAKNAYGSKVKLKAAQNRAVLRLAECGWLKALMELPASARIPRESFCEGCLAYFSTVATDLGLKLKGKLLEKGCRMTVRKKA
jgi:hypothetical protein